MNPNTRRLAVSIVAAVGVANAAAIVWAIRQPSAAGLLPWQVHLAITVIAGGFLLAAWSDARRRAGRTQHEFVDRAPAASLTESLRRMGLLDHLKKSDRGQR